ncbi:MAG: dihydrodipicolinate synthase family protein [Desulfobulbaceae bacterium]|nr:dihydrodipicolinate synthase family protein [Desulfobulbaceae bacterium]
MNELKGICVPVSTPFKDKGAEIDESALKDHIDFLIESGVHIICLNGGTAEFPFLSAKEKRRIVEFASKHIDGRCKIISHVSCVRTEDTIEESLHALNNGSDAIMVLPPFFEGPDVEGVIWHYDKISKAVGLPIIAYNIPACSDFDITPDIFERLMQIEHVSYIKESTSIMLRVEDLVPTGAKVFCGCDFLMLYALMAGAVGCFWGGANAYPKEAVKLYDLFTAGKLSEALALWQNMQPLNRLFWTIPFNPAVKEAMNLAGRSISECRLPVQPLTAEQKSLAKSRFDKLFP